MNKEELIQELQQLNIWQAEIITELQKHNQNKGWRIKKE